MKHSFKAFFVIGILSCTALASESVQPARNSVSIDSGWKFTKDPQTDAQMPEFDDGAWRSLDLPHDWSIEGPYSETNPTGGSGGYLPAGVGWYRKHLTVPESMRGKKVIVQFDGVYMNSDVWLNGQHFGNYPYGYSSFYYDLTPWLNFDGKNNVLAVRVDNLKQPNSRWYSGSGIYRHVWLTATDPLHVAHWGTYITTPKVSTQSATVQIRTYIENDNAEDREATLVSQIFDAEDRLAATVETKQNIPAKERQEFDQTVDIANPHLWSIDDPYLYRVKSLVKYGDKLADDYETSVGVREIRYDVDKGFFLNGEHVKMQGMCIHHDGGCVGAAVPEGVWQRRLQLLKAMGCNAIRMSHNPPAPEMLDLCDRMGFLVMDEAFDQWKIAKTPQDYSRYFDQWSIKDLTAMLHRDRNHPSIVMWSVGNEIPEQTRPYGAEVLRPLVELCHKEDPTRPVTSACDNIAADGGGTTPEFLNLLDIVGYNYADRWHLRRETMYSDDRHDYPQRTMVGSESTCVGGVRGNYNLGSGNTDRGPRGSYASAMIRAEQLWKFVKVHDYVIGDFMWTGIDYLGESRWPGKSSSSGVLDTCGFPKDGYYFYQSQWTTKPMLHTFPHWNWKGREGQIITVLCYTNCDQVELFLNGKSFGVKALEFPRQGASGGWNSYARPQVFSTTADLHLSWDVPYEPGTLKAVGSKEGKIVCTEEVRTAGEPAAIAMSADRATLRSDARDVAHFTVKVVDAQGITVPNADSLITFDLQGSGALIGVDNGNPASHEDYKANTRKAFGGMCLAIVKSTGEQGKIRLSARAEGLKEAVVNIEANQNAAPALLP
ncbi:MAG: glycoside hydrolase family 2 TIM barrel-domain containing protein [Thermoguttaceae bacterium]